ncbi:MAG TPA: putative baseplate assembly protein, partial [Candidatus Sulfopaludibacter sp.]|nr:putative baseplate assembly protein [Candidatus Sulfopaludibacter sp.]
QLMNDSCTQWLNFYLTSTIDLDTSYPKIVAGGWLAMIHPDAQSTRIPAGYISLYLINSVAPVSRSDYGLSSKITRVIPDLTSNLGQFSLRTTQIIGQSEQLTVAEQPLTYPLYGTRLDLETLRPDLAGATVVAITGKSQKIAVKPRVNNLWFVPDDGTPHKKLNSGDVLTVTDPNALLNPDGTVPDWSTAGATLTISVIDYKGRPGSVQSALQNFTLALSSSSDPDVEECALVSSVTNELQPFPHTQLRLKANLVNCYDRSVTTVNANVALATHGQSVSEVMGNGSAATPNQSFTLKQSPLTYIQAPTPTGRLSTLQVRANSVAWKEAPSLYQQSPTAQVFSTLNQADGTTDVLFGDGVEGSTLPTGTNNIQANYRIGSGGAGNVAAGTITTLLDRPLGVSGVTNPQAATGGQDPQSVDDVRTNAPQTVLTLGRAVSITDYENYASTFAGIAKAQAIWIPSGPARGVFLTVAGVGGAALPPANPTLVNLVTSLQNFGNPLIPISAQSFLETLFGIEADLAYDPKYDNTAVQTAVLAALVQTYSFANRTFGQGVTSDEISAVIQAVAGVVAVNVTAINVGDTSAAGDLASEGGGASISALNAWLSQKVPIVRPDSGSPLRVCPYLPVASAQAAPNPAEILVLDPNPASVVLGTMS